MLLAQLSFDGPDFPRLPSPPLIPHLLFESPILPAVGLLLTAIVAWVTLRHRLGRRKASLNAASLAALAIANLLAARFVTTDREKVIAATRELIRSIARPDAAAVKDLTQPGAWAWAYQRWEGDVLHELIAQAERNHGRYDVAGTSFTITDYTIRSIRALVQSHNIAKTQANITGTTDAGANATWFEFDWDKTPDGDWKLRSATLLWDTIGGNHKRP